MLQAGISRGIRAMSRPRTRDHIQVKAEDNESPQLTACYRGTGRLPTGDLLTDAGNPAALEGDCHNGATSFVEPRISLS